MKDNKKKADLVTTTIILIAVVLIAIFLFILFSLKGSEEHITYSKDNEIISALTCETGNQELSFFNSKTANDVVNKLKITFNEDTIDKISYNYEGIYGANEAAKKDETNFHAKYNIYMGENGISQESLSPSYSVVNNKLGIVLYLDDYNLITPITAKFFFIAEDEIESYKKSSIDQLKRFYDNKGFSCQIIN